MFINVSGCPASFGTRTGLDEHAVNSLVWFSQIYFTLTLLHDGIVIWFIFATNPSIIKLFLTHCPTKCSERVSFGKKCCSQPSGSFFERSLMNEMRLVTA
jgi:hypothetical protein